MARNVPQVADTEMIRNEAGLLVAMRQHEFLIYCKMCGFVTCVSVFCSALA